MTSSQQVGPAVVTEGDKYRRHLLRGRSIDGGLLVDQVGHLLRDAPLAEVSGHQIDLVRIVVQYLIATKIEVDPLGRRDHLHDGE